jgi:hypothetical protein
MHPDASRKIFSEYPNILFQLLHNAVSHYTSYKRQRKYIIGHAWILKPVMSVPLITPITLNRTWRWFKSTLLDSMTLMVSRVAISLRKSSNVSTHCEHRVRIICSLLVTTSGEFKTQRRTRKNAQWAHLPAPHHWPLARRHKQEEP